MKKTILNVTLAVLVLIVGTSCKKECQTCTIEYSYEYTDTDSNGNEVTVTEEGTEISNEECEKSKDLDDMEATWEQNRKDLITDLEGQGAENITATLTCERK